MPFKNLTPTQQAFISNYLKKGWLTRGTDKRIVKSYEEYLPSETKFNGLIAELPADDPQVMTLVAEAAPIMKFTPAAKFKKEEFGQAVIKLEPLIERAQNLKTEFAEKRTAFLAELGKLTDPVSATPEQKRAMKVDRDAAIDALKPALPGAPAFAIARKSIDALNKKVQPGLAVDALATKSESVSDAALKTMNSFDAELGDIDLTPKFIADAKKAYEDAVRDVSTAEKALRDAEALPDGTKDEKRIREEEKKKAIQSLKASKATRIATKKTRMAALGKQMLTEAITVGPLSADTGRPLSEASAVKMMEAFARDPELTNDAIKLAQKSSNPDAIADQMDKMCDRVANGFHSPGAKFAWPEDTARKYAADLLKAGDAQGGDYFKDMDAYLLTGRQLMNPTFSRNPKTYADLANMRSQELGKAMIGPDGKIDPNTPQARNAFDDLRFQQRNVQLDTPSLTKHITETIGVLRNPVEGPKCAAVVNALKAPTKTTPKGLVSKALGKAPTDPITDEDTRAAVMAAFMTPVDQGKVGSCFTTAPARRFRDVNPSGALEGMAEIATKGTFTSASGVKVPATTKVHQGQDPILRGWEYSVATAAATEAGSRERNTLRTCLFAADGLGAVEQITGSGTWAVDKGKLETAVGNAFMFIYDPTSEIVDSNDGSSSTGRYQIFQADTFGAPVGDALITKDKFVTALTEVALKSLGLKATDADGKKITALVKTDKFINAICPGIYKPWELSSGGMELGPTKALFGGAPATSTLLDKNMTKPPPDEGARTKDVLLGILEKIGGETDQYLNIGTAGIHSFNALPTEGSMKDLIGADPTQSAKNVEDKLVKPGRDIAAKTLPVERVAYLYDQQFDALIAKEKDDALKKELQAAADANRPNTEAKPAKISTAVEAALKVYCENKAKSRADEWRTEETTAGNVVSDPDYIKKLATIEAALKKSIRDGVASTMIIDLGFPEVKIADTNWGDERDHAYFVIAPDPSTGELRLWQKNEPGGSFAAMDREWIDTTWDMTK